MASCPKRTKSRSTSFAKDDKVRVKRRKSKMVKKMDKNMRNHYNILLDTDHKKFLSDLSAAIKANQNQRVYDLLAIMEKKSQCKLKIKLYREGEDNSESLLHVAVKYEDDPDIIQRIIDLCPDLLSIARESSENYRGQTPLHIAITKRQEELTELLLEASERQDEYNKRPASLTRLTMIHTPATGRIFTNTVMMGELPLSVAALSFNENIVDLLIDHGADIHSKNKSGDTVLHSLVKYAAVYPDKTDNVISMLSYFNSKFKAGNSDNPSHVQDNIDSDIGLREHSYVWFLKNGDRLTPLQLSAKLGVVEVFQFIIKLENVYSLVSTHDGLFDIKLYDITEIDTVAKLQETNSNVYNEGYNKRKVSKNIDGVSRTNIKTTQDCTPVLCSQFNYPETESILEMMFDFDYQSGPAFRIIETIPVKNIIQEKWKKLRYVYFLWGLVHFILTICLTAEVVIRSDLYASNSATNNTSLGKFVSKASKGFADGISYFSFAIGGVLYGLLVILLTLAKLRRRNALRYVFHNLFYYSFLLIFAGSLIVDFIMTLSLNHHDNIALTIAVITGWSFAIFFLRAIHLFGYFTEMIRRVIFGDLLRFSVIISFMLVAFTAGIYAAFIGNFESVKDFDAYNEAVSDSFDSYGGAMITMFRLMLGLDDVGVLSQARLPWLATTLYIIFAVLTYVLLMNSLIAMMSQTCSIVCENRYPQWRLQMLSVILFLEDLFCLACIRNTFKSPGEEKSVRSFDPVTKQSTENVRFYLKIHSLEASYATEEDKEALKKTKIEDIHPRFDGTLRSDTGSCSPYLNSGLYQYSMRRQGYNGITCLPIPDINITPTPRVQNTENNSPPQSAKTEPDSARRKSSRRHVRQLSRVIEEDRPAIKKIGSEPDVIQREKSPKSKRRRYNSENMHERYNRRSPRPTASGSNDTINRSSDSLLTPVDLTRVHEHSRKCPERRENLVPNGYSHVDIEPYPHSSA